ncbi:L-ascorbate metabolism protein UlaG (beta-lactamase superfamily) [Asanoa ferruginea]|uniref:L-ascorbate metabolism protein UlaG (Beta-lactamase superfamily) n=1 Tax=Asanoa ferruginea TaxID=53367 RepID=A0A3D9ZHY1_9ACTN|nr:MBL fold metallo-hydrolase [Asanoa ferruginea]REF97008.1 L-ascorbate metabolism protein UlaG (beta-lactamase superfamily) [Asanoa ferruginea]GIF50198.1 MBL fold metallo-hydrolase [Asanoa ferruginea]
MRLTKFGHSCVRVEHDGAVLVIDPGSFSERAALDGVDAVLITHAHPDHLDVDALTDALAKRPEVIVHTHTDVAKELTSLGGVVNTVASGQSFSAAGLPIEAFGGIHAEIHPDIPRIANLGFLINESVYHPGDSFDVPEGARVETLFVPVSAPWLKISESVDFVRAVAPRRAFALHDGVINEAGGKLVDGVMTRLLKVDYQRLTPGTSVDA